MEDRYDCIRRILGDGSLEGIYNTVIDVGQVTNNPTENEFKMVGYLVKILQEKLKGRVAIINGYPGRTTITHLITANPFVQEKHVQPFYSMKEALDWLSGR